MKFNLAVVTAIVALLVAASTSNAAIHTYGSLAPAYSGPQGCSGCGWFQASVSSGPSYAAPVDGTITTFRMRLGDASAATENVLFTVVRPLGGGQFTIVHRTAVVSLANKPANSIADIPVSIPVQAGDALGIEYSTNKVRAGWGPVGGTSSDLQWSTGAIALNTPWTPSSSLAPYRLNLEIVLDDGQPDPTGPTGGNSPLPDTTAPVLTGFKSKNTRFKVNPRGAIVAKSTPKGTRFALTLSEAASVKFTVQVAVRKKGRTVYKTVHSFARILGAGASSTTYSGRYRDSKKKKKVLKPGRYKVTATPTDTAGLRGATASAKFTLVR